MERFRSFRDLEIGHGMEKDSRSDGGRRWPIMPPTPRNSLVQFNQKGAILSRPWIVQDDNSHNHWVQG